MKKLLSVIAIATMVCSFSSKEITWVAIGDSITYLNDHPDETGSRVKKGYLTMVTEKLPGMHYTNQGYSGWTSGGIADKIDELGIIKADVYSIFLGTNDWWQGRAIGTLADYQKNTGNNTYFGSLRIIVNKLRSLNRDAKIILITPMQRTDFVYLGDMTNNAYGCYKNKNGQSLKAFAAAVNEIALYEKMDVVDLYNKSGITLNNMVKFKRLKNPQTGKYSNYPYPSYIDVPFNPATDEYPYPPESIGMTYDGLHPSDEGNAVIAQMLVNTMKKYWSSLKQ
jgi:lysophospholipase L1-like esterase